MSKLFPSQLVLEQAPPQAIGFQYLSGSRVTVVASKATQRYRIQSESLAALAPTLSWLLKRLEDHFKSASTPPAQGFTARFTSALPLNEYFQIIDRHLKVLVLE